MGSEYSLNRKFCRGILGIRMKIELITPESEPSRRLRKWRLIRFPQLTMPLLAAYTPPGVELHHTEEIVEPVDLDREAGSGCDHL